MKNLLIIAPYFIPRRRVGALRPFRFASHLAESSWNVSVITIGSDELPTPAERKYLEKMTILEIPPPFDRTYHSEAPKIKASQRSSEKKKVNLIAKLGAWVDRNTPLDTWIYLFGLRYGKIRSFAKNQKPDVIWATGDPWSGLWLGEKLSSELDIPFIADFRDPWTLAGLNLRKRSKFSESADIRYEKRIIGGADKIIFTSGATADLYRRHYQLPADKIKVIFNSYSDLFEDDKTQSGNKIRFEKESFHILFLGRFRRLSPAAVIITVLEHLQEKDMDKAARVVIHSFGEILPTDLKRIKETGIEKQFKIHEQVNPQHIQTILEHADLLLVSTAPERETIIPAKLWDYFSTNKPVLAISANGEIREILKTAGGGVYFSFNQLDEVADFISLMMNSKESGKEFPVPEINPAVRKKFSSSAVASQLNRILEETIAHGKK